MADNEYDDFDRDFAGIDDAPLGYTSRYLPLGTHLLMINNVSVGKTRAGVAMFAAEFTLIRSSNPEAEEGGTYSWVTTKTHDVFLQNVKNFILGVLQMPKDPPMDHTQVTPEIVRLVGADSGAYVRGWLVTGVTTQKTTKVKKQLITPTSFSSVSEDDWMAHAPERYKINTQIAADQG